VNGATAIFLGMKTKEEEKEHYNFLNQMRVRLNVDEAKIIDLEARISCKYTFYLILDGPPFLIEGAALFNSDFWVKFN
jgi:hypothetical protein